MQFNLDPKVAPKRYIRPTQGLGIRSGPNGGGGSMTVNLENIGGRILIMEEMNTHKARLKTVKPMVNMLPPWGHTTTLVKSRPSSAATATTSKRSGSRPDSSRGNGRKSAAAYNYNMEGYNPNTSGKGAAAVGTNGSVQDFDVSTLSSEHQQAYSDMVRVLCTMSNADSRRLLEQLYKESEERKLLSAYTGIFPTLEHDELANSHHVRAAAASSSSANVNNNAEAHSPSNKTDNSDYEY